ncbi:uncharacterized protein LOC144747421 [Ciona intestinalis]
MLRHYESTKIAEDYRKYRPQYPPQLAQVTLEGNFDLKEHKFDYLLDVGCGAGQSANVFAPYFHEVLAIDPSENQLKEARFQNKFSHVTYRTGIAEELPVDDASVDVITAGTSVHWFDREKFFKEVDRVLKPGGRLVLFVYWTPRVYPIDIPGQFNYNPNIVSDELLAITTAPFLRKMVLANLNGYSEIFHEIPYQDKRRFDTISSDYFWSLEDVKGLVRSEDPHDCYMEDKRKEFIHLPEELRNKEILEADVSEQITKTLRSAWGCLDKKDADVRVKAVYDFHAMVARKPKL